MARIYYGDVSPLLGEGALERALDRLPPFQRERVKAMRRIEDRARSAGAWCLLLAALKEEGTDFAGRTFFRQEGGKPCLSGPGAPQFNLTHGGMTAACAVGRGPVGADFQPITAARPAVVRRCFAPEEAAALAALPPGERDGALCRVWSAKESAAKALGRGLALPFDRLVICREGERAFARWAGRELPLFAWPLAGGWLTVCAGEDCAPPRLLPPEILWNGLAPTGGAEGRNE